MRRFLIATNGQLGMTKHVLLLAGLLLAAIPVAGQTSDAVEEDPGLIITTESSLVMVPLHVYNGKKSVDGLGEEAFELLENGVAKDIAFVEGPGSGGRGRTVPIEIIVLLDVSHSVMRPGLLSTQAIRDTLLTGGLRDDVSISVYAFARSLTRLTGPTRDIARIEQAFDRAYDFEDDQTRVFEAMLETLRDATSRGGNASRMLLVFSDGLSTTQLDPVWVARGANLLGVPIYPVVLGHRPGGSNRAQKNVRIRTLGKQEDFIDPLKRGGVASQSESRDREREMRRWRFAELGLQTGGRSFDLKIPSGLATRSILTSVADLAQTEYIVGYYPSSLGEEPTEREIEVRLSPEVKGKLYGGRRTLVH